MKYDFRSFMTLRGIGESLSSVLEFKPIERHSFYTSLFVSHLLFQNLKFRAHVFSAHVSGFVLCQVVYQPTISRYDLISNEVCSNYISHLGRSFCVIFCTANFLGFCLSASFYLEKTYKLLKFEGK